MDLSALIAIGSHALLSEDLRASESELSSADSQARARLEAHVLLAEQLLGLAGTQRTQANADTYDLALALQINFQSEQGTQAEVLARQRVGERTEEYRNTSRSERAAAIARAIAPESADAAAAAEGYATVTRRR